MWVKFYPTYNSNTIVKKIIHPNRLLSDLYDSIWYENEYKQYVGQVLRHVPSGLIRTVTVELIVRTVKLIESLNISLFPYNEEYG